jgi:spore germination protein (amino acid permease)
MFGRWEAFALILNLMTTQVFLGYTNIAIETSGTAGWILPLYTASIAAIIFAIISSLYKPFEGKDLIDVAQIAVGSVGRVFTGLLFMVYLISLNSMVIRMYSESMKVIAFSISPISYVVLFFITGMVVGAHKGIEAIVRLAAVAMLAIIIAFLIITLGIIPYYEFEGIQPILGNGVKSIFYDGLSQVSRYSAFSALFFIYPFIKTHKNFRFVGFASIVAASLAFSWATLTYLAAFRYPVALEKFLPIYHMARLINLGRFFQRVESLFILAWVVSAMIYISMSFYNLIYVFKRTFKLEYERPLIFPFTILLFSIGFLPQNIMQVMAFEQNYVRNYVLIIVFIFPILLLIIARVRKKEIVKGGLQDD